MTKQWRCYECGEVISYGEKCGCCECAEVPEEFLTPQQISDLNYHGTYED